MDVYNGTYTDTVGRELGCPEIFIQRNFDTTEAQRLVFEKAVAGGATLLYGTHAGDSVRHQRRCRPYGPW